MSVLPVGFGSATNGGGFNVERSLRFNSADSAELNRTFGTPINNKIFTISAWVKTTNPSAGLLDFSLLSVGDAGIIGIAGTGAFGVTYVNRIFIRNGSATGDYWLPVLRDVSAWYHIVIAIDTTQATQADRAKLWINGVSQASNKGASTLSLNATMSVNAASTTHYIGGRGAASYYSNGYLTEYNFVDGQALTPSSFGETDSATGVWKPKAFSGTYGTNGFYLKFLPSYSGGSISADYLVVAGGGGGSGARGGGGGGGGYREFTSQSIAVGTAFTVTVGAGGAGNNTNQGFDGSNSVFSTITSTGGGGGGGDTTSAGRAGGSGGGSRNSGTGGAGNTPSTSPSQGNNGGGGGSLTGGGGGGAGAVGATGVNSVSGGNGGNGTASSISGSSVTRAGGGGGGNGVGEGTAGTGGAGGGGAGSVTSSPPTTGTANTGGGGGGGSNSGGGVSGVAGGSGVVIIKIPSQYSANFTSGVTYSISTAVSGFKIYTVTATSTTSETVTFV